MSFSPLCSQFLSLLTRYRCSVRLATQTKRHTDVTQLHKVTPKPQSCLNKDAQIKSKEMGGKTKRGWKKERKLQHEMAPAFTHI